MWIELLGQIETMFWMWGFWGHSKPHLSPPEIARFLGFTNNPGSKAACFSRLGRNGGHRVDSNTTRPTDLPRWINTHGTDARLWLIFRVLKKLTLTVFPFFSLLFEGVDFQNTYFTILERLHPQSSLSLQVLITNEFN